MFRLFINDYMQILEDLCTYIASYFYMSYCQSPVAHVNKRFLLNILSLIFATNIQASFYMEFYGHLLPSNDLLFQHSIEM